MELIVFCLFIFFVILVVLFFKGFLIINQYERGLLLTFGKYSGQKEPGLNWIIPYVQTVIKVDMRTITSDVPRQEVITSDNVSVRINAVLYYRVISPEKAYLQVQNIALAVNNYAQATLRDIIGNITLDVLLSQRDSIADKIKEIVEQITDPWGVRIEELKLQDIEIDAAIKTAMAREAEAARESKAIVVKSEGELVAAQRIAEAARIINSVPGGITIRTLNALEQISSDPAKTIIFTLPIELVESLRR